jgi:hypothetical protein
VGVAGQPPPQTPATGEPAALSMESVNTLSDTSRMCGELQPEKELGRIATPVGEWANEACRPMTVEREATAGKRRPAKEP